MNCHPELAAVRMVLYYIVWFSHHTVNQNATDWARSSQLQQCWLIVTSVKGGVSGVTWVIQGGQTLLIQLKSLTVFKFFHCLQLMQVLFGLHFISQRDFSAFEIMETVINEKHFISHISHVPCMNPCQLQGFFGEQTTKSDSRMNWRTVNLRHTNGIPTYPCVEKYTGLVGFTLSVAIILSE